MIDDDIRAIAATRRASRELADGTLRVQIDIEPNDKLAFLNLFPHQGDSMAVARLEDEVAQRASQRGWGNYARILKVSSFFRTPEVWHAIGTDADFLDWLRAQKCASCGWEPRFEGNAWVGCDAAHRRRAGGSGTAYKEPYSAIPLCTRCHRQLQHQHGESAVGGKAWFDRQRILHLAEWGWQRVKEAHHVESMRDLDPAELYAWAQRHEVDRFLPAEYREAA